MLRPWPDCPKRHDRAAGHEYSVKSDGCPSGLSLANLLANSLSNVLSKGSVIPAYRRNWYPSRRCMIKAKYGSDELPPPAEHPIPEPGREMAFTHFKVDVRHIHRSGPLGPHQVLACHHPRVGIRVA